MAKELENLYWVEDLLPKSLICKRMFGGFAYYTDERLVLLMFESVGNKEYRGAKFDYEIWNGCMFPVEKEHHAAVLAKYSFLRNHPILPKWLYVPVETENFESHIESIIPEIRRKNPMFGSIIKARGAKAKSKLKASKKVKAEKPEKIDTRRPQMFRDAPAEDVLAKAKKISDFKNIGPETEKAFVKAGIKTPKQFIKLGWKKTMVQLCKVNPKNNHSLFAYAIIGALKNQMWNQIAEEDKLEARDFMKSLRDKATSKKKKK